MSARDELIQLIWDGAVADRVKEGKDPARVPVVRPKVEAMADAILADGYRRPRTITTAEEANRLPDRSAILTPGQIIFHKWEDYYGEGKHAWERELGKMVPAEMLSDEGHFPASVLYEPGQP